MKAKLFSLLMACLFLASCFDEKSSIQKMIPKDQDTIARHFVDLVRTGDYPSAEQMLAPEAQGTRVPEALRAIHQVLDHGEPIEIETIGFNTTVFRPFNTSSEDTSKTNLVYQIHFKDAWATGNVYLEKKSAEILVLGARFRPIADSLEALNRFTLVGKSPLHFFVLTLFVTIPSFILYTLVVCIRSPIRRKWLWIIFILFGLAQFRFDWTSGLYDFQPITILLFGVGCIRSTPYSPWIFELALPVGALVFLLRRRKLIFSKPLPIPETVPQKPF